MLKKFVNDFKNNRYTTIWIIVFILLVVLGFAVYRFLFPNIGSPVYGNRLDGIDKVQVTEKQMDKLSDALKEKEFVTSASSYVKGKIYNVVVKVKDGTSVADTKSLTTIIIENVEEDQKKYFDIQVFFTNENEEAVGYPMIGYLNKGSTEFLYSESK